MTDAQKERVREREKEKGETGRTRIEQKSQPARRTNTALKKQNNENRIK